MRRQKRIPEVVEEQRCNKSGKGNRDVKENVEERQAVFKVGYKQYNVDDELVLIKEKQT